MKTANIPVYGNIAVYIHLFSIFIIKTSWARAALAPLDLLIVKTLTHVIYYIIWCIDTSRRLSFFQYSNILTRQSCFYW